MREQFIFYRDKNQPLLIMVDRLSDTKSNTATHDWDILWHIDSEVEKQTDKYIRFSDVDIAWSNGETSIIVGQETPEWQGFIATGTKQGMYRAVPCVDTKVNANAVRIVTVLAPYQAGAQCKRLVGVKASLDAADMDITLVFDDGSEWALNEEELRKLA